MNVSADLNNFTEKTKECKEWFCELVTISQSNATDTNEAWSRVYPVYSIISTEFAVFSHISKCLKKYILL